MLHGDGCVDTVAKGGADFVADVEVVLVGAAFKEVVLEVIFEAAGRAGVVYTEVDGAAVGVDHSADDAHDVVGLLSDVGTHVVVGREDNGCLELGNLVFFAEGVDDGQFDVDVEQIFYLADDVALMFE